MMKWKWFKSNADSKETTSKPTPNKSSSIFKRKPILSPPQLPPDVWIQICQCSISTRFPHLNQDYDMALQGGSKNDIIRDKRRRRRNDSSLLLLETQHSDSIVSSWTGSISKSNSHSSSTHELDLIQTSKTLSLISKHLYYSVAHLRFSILILWNSEALNEQLLFFQGNAEISNNVRRLMVDLECLDPLSALKSLIPPTQQRADASDLEQNSSTSSTIQDSIPGHIKNVACEFVAMKMDHFCSLKLLELSALLMTSSSSIEGTDDEESGNPKLLIPNLKGLENLKFLIINSSEWIELLFGMHKVFSNSSTSQYDELPRLSRLIINSYSLLARPLIPIYDPSIREQIQRDIKSLKVDLKRNGFDGFLKSLLGFGSEEESDEEQSSGEAIGKIIIKQGLPTIRSICLELQEKLKEELDPSNRFGDFVVVGEFKSWSSNS